MMLRVCLMWQGGDAARGAREPQRGESASDVGRWRGAEETTWRRPALLDQGGRRRGGAICVGCMTREGGGAPAGRAMASQPTEKRK